MTEAKIAAGVIVAQDFLCVYRFLELLRLTVELPMLLEMDNSEALDIMYSWSVGGHMHHIDVCNYILCKLKDQGVLIIKYIPGDKNDADIFIKNLKSVVFNSHVPPYVGVMNT
jgi:hypothetical protein